MSGLKVNLMNSSVIVCLMLITSACGNVYGGSKITASSNTPVTNLTASEKVLSQSGIRYSGGATCGYGAATACTLSACATTSKAVCSQREAALKDYIDKLYAAYGARESMSPYELNLADILIDCVDQLTAALATSTGTNCQN